MEQPWSEIVEASVTRTGVVLEPNGDATEIEGILNPAAVRTRDGALLLYPRMVAAGNVSRIGIVAVDEHKGTYDRRGFALVPHTDYELREHPSGYGCEDPRVTFVAALDRYVMAYTAFGPSGPRVAIAISSDGWAWERLGLVDFSATGLPDRDDKDAAFFPGVVLSPDGVESLAFYHRPMHPNSISGGYQPNASATLALPASERESIRIAYVEFAAIKRDVRALLRPRESVLVVSPIERWGRLKTGAGTPPVRIGEGWLSIYHGVDEVVRDQTVERRYSAGIVVHDLERPHVVRYLSPHPVLVPETTDELRGIVNNVVFPTGIAATATPRSFDIYYGMADARVGRARLDLGEERLREHAA